MAEYDNKLLDGEHLGYYTQKVKTAINGRIADPISKSNGQVLTFNGTNWVAQTPSAPQSEKEVFCISLPGTEGTTITPEEKAILQQIFDTPECIAQVNDTIVSTYKGTHTLFFEMETYGYFDTWKFEVIDGVITGDYTFTEVNIGLSNFDNDTNFISQDELDNALSTKQDTLTAGNNITIVGNVISATTGGEPATEVFVANVGTTTYAELEAADNAGKTIIAKWMNQGNAIYGYRAFNNGENHKYGFIFPYTTVNATSAQTYSMRFDSLRFYYRCCLSNNVWPEQVSIEAQKKLTASTGISIASDNKTISVDTSVVASKSDLNGLASETWVTDKGYQNATQVNSAITTAISGLTGFHFEIVSALPQTGETNIIYLVLKSSGSTGNIYSEYAWINNAWESLGDTSVNLEFLTNSEIDSIWSEA